jgi:isoleucyl-tRNA synthetase
VPYAKNAIEKAKAEGKKTSYIEPDVVIAKSGTELFRLWVASTEFRSDIPYSQAILDGLSEWYRKLRNTARFLLGNLEDFDPAAVPRPSERPQLDHAMAEVVAAFEQRCRAAYERYELHLVHRALVEFVTVDVSARYSDIVKDRLYSDAVDSQGRRSAQWVLWDCITAIAKAAAPILCFTAEDIWRHIPKAADAPDSVHLATFAAPREPNARALAEWAFLMEWRERVNAALEPFRAEKHKSVDAHVIVTAKDEAVAGLRRFADELADLFIVSSVELADGEPGVTVQAHAGPRCERCWKHYAQLAADPNDVCERCATALRAHTKAP